jgi:hypothetical protein
MISVFKIFEHKPDSQFGVIATFDNYDSALQRAKELERLRPTSGFVIREHKGKTQTELIRLGADNRKKGNPEYHKQKKREYRFYKEFL